MSQSKDKLRPKQPDNLLGRFWQAAWHKGLWRRLGFCLLAMLILFTSSMYVVSEWYIHKHSNEPLVLGASFIPDYTESLGVDPKETLTAMMSDLQLKQVRLVSYWDDIESQQGKYNFSSLDWQFALANKYHTNVSLAIGLRQPRWPECHEPQWAKAETKSQWQPQLYKFMGAVIERYKNNPALSSYELENEFFMKVFGTCTDFDRSRLVSEYSFVKAMDPKHKVIISRSDNWVGIPVGNPTPDQFAISVYKRVWDGVVTHRYFEYPLPAHFYAALAGSEELLSGKDMIIHELQAEPWAPHGLQLNQISVEEQSKSMDADRLKSRIAYGEATGMKTIDLWGAEWWYWLKIKQHDPSAWNVVKQAVTKANQENAKLDPAHTCSGLSGYTQSNNPNIICD